MGHRMSAEATYSKGRTSRYFGAVETVAACGPLAVALVGIGGFAFGFFLWYTALTQLGDGPGLWVPLLVVCLFAGMVSTFVGWYAYGVYFARRAGVGVITAMRWDAWSWASFATFGLGFVLPVHYGTPAHATALAVGLFSLAKILIAARFVHTVRDVLVTFVITRAAIIVIAELASIVIAQRPGEHVAESTNGLLAVWGRWDAVHYLEIARSGYYGTDMAFFPLYPLLIHVAGIFVGNELIAGLLISNVALFFGLLFFYKLVEHQFTRAVAHRAIFYVSIFPTAVFFSAVYTESLFFCLTVASFYYIREHKWLTAGIVGGLAALTRVEGVLLFVPYAIEVFLAARSSGFAQFFGHNRRLARVIVGACTIPLGLLAYMAALWVINGDPLYFTHVQTHWDRHLAWPWMSIGHAAKVISHAKTPLAVANETIELAFTALMIAVLIGGFSRLRPTFSAYMVLSILVPMSTSSLMSMPRFALVLFPMFVILALWGGRSWVNTTIVAFSLPLLGLFTVLFANWYWVA
jgi:hypothetical protein